MCDDDIERLFNALLVSARLLREVSTDADTDDESGLPYKRSTLGLASLIEMWSIDNAALLVPEALEGLSSATRDDDGALIAALAAHFDPAARTVTH